VRPSQSVPPRNPKTFFIAAQRDRIGRVGLQLHRIGTRVFGGANDLDCALEALVVVRRELGNDVRRLARPDVPVRNLDVLRH
jgi:Lhr-like helicase